MLLPAAFTGGVLIWGGKGSKDAKLPITLGPQKPAVSISTSASSLLMQTARRANAFVAVAIHVRTNFGMCWLQLLWQQQSATTITACVNGPGSGRLILNDEHVSPLQVVGPRGRV